jgi:hypothetical protein
VNRIVLPLVLCALATGVARAADSDPAPPGCIGSAPLGKFRVSVSRAGNSAVLPISDVSSIPPGAHLIWDPVHLSHRISRDGEVAALIVPAKRGGDLVVLPARKAGQGAVWDLPQGAEVVALVIGPDGLSMGKVKSLVARNEDLLSQLASYAQQTSQVESLVQTLADSEQTGGGADAALKGFSSRWGVSVPKLDAKAPPDQQASTLLSAILPSATTYDPLAPSGAQMQQTTGLAASIAGLFFGNTVGLAAGGAALVTNLKSSLFPNTEFRSAYAQSAGAGVMAFCAKNAAMKSRTRTAYLWAYRVPGLALPSVTLAGPSFLPTHTKSTVAVKPAEGSNTKELARAREWRLVPAAGGEASPISVAPGNTPDTLTLDLSKSSAAPGDYQLTANWDWEKVTLGTLHLRSYSDFAHAQITPASRDQLVQGNGVVTAKLTGADFEFVDKVEWQKATARPGKPTATAFELPVGPRGGPQETMSVDMDTSSPGEYRLLLSQSDGVAHNIPVTVLPPNPKFSNLPVRVNLGETDQAIRFTGAGLERIDTMTSDAGALEGAGRRDAWQGTIRLKSEAKTGERFPVSMKVRGLEAPLIVPDAIVVVGARPKIVSAQRSLIQDPGSDGRSDELPAGSSVGFAINVERLRDPEGARPRLELSCRSGELRKALSLSPDEHAEGASLTIASEDSLYLSLDPGVVGYPGCELTASVSVDPRGASDAFVLGRVVRLPSLEKFTLTNEALGPNSYVGILQGRDLAVIEKTGWDPQNGLPVTAIPAPMPGSNGAQTLRIAVPWPAPAPHAPLFIWLRGEQSGRRTRLSD